MPYAWTDDSKHKMLLWPHNSLAPRGFVVFIGVTAGLFLLPLMAVLGSPILWGLLPFMLGVLAAAWWAIDRNRADRRIREELTLTATEVHLTRHDKTGTRHWQANRYWVRVASAPKGGPVDHYLTLEGGPRRVEIGAFLSAEERLTLRDEIEIALRQS